MSALAAPGRGARSWSPVVEAALGLRDPDQDLIIFKEDSHYQRVLVLHDGPKRREMHLDKLLHSKVDLDDPLDLKYEYEGVYAQVTRHLRPSGPVSALFVGGGGDVFPRYMEIVHPGSYLEVIEIDPVVTKAAFEAFGVPASSTIQHFAMDARNRVADLIRDKRRGEQVPSFDFIYGDAFSDFSVPYHLTTLESPSL